MLQQSRLNVREQNMKKVFSPASNQSLLLVIDIQQKLAPAMTRYEQVKAVAKQLGQAAVLFDVPSLVTEQYKQGLGETDELLKSQLVDAQYFDKTHFSAYKEPGFKELIACYKKPHIIVVGMEAHVCVLQTCLDLLAQDYNVFIIADGVCSRQDSHRDIAIAQLKEAGAIISNAESVIFQWAEVAATEQFKKVLKIVK